MNARRLQPARFLALPILFVVLTSAGCLPYGCVPGEPQPSKKAASKTESVSAAPTMPAQAPTPDEANPNPGDSPKPGPITTPEHRPPPPLPPPPVQTFTSPEHPQPKPVPPQHPSKKTTTRRTDENRPEAGSAAQTVATETARSVTKEVNRAPPLPPPPPPPPPARHGPP